jgi:hypothetical protein
MIVPPEGAEGMAIGAVLQSSLAWARRGRSRPISLGKVIGDGKVTNQATGTRATSAAELHFIDAAGGWTSADPGFPGYRATGLQIVERSVS